MSSSTRIPTVHAPHAPRHVLSPLQNWLAQNAAAGVVFEDGQEFQIGWMWFRIGVDSRGTRVTAPKVGAPSLFYVDDCSEALSLIAAQQSILGKFGLEAADCDCRQTALIVRDLSTCSAPFIDRLSYEMDGRSGWYIGAHDSQLDVMHAENLKLVPVWEILSRRPELGPYLLLPPTWQVSFEGQPVVMRERQVILPHAGRVGVARAAC